jgi:hypothetical protein
VFAQAAESDPGVPDAVEIDRLFRGVRLGGYGGDRPDEMFTRWQRAPELPGVRGLAAGRNLQYPPGGDVDTAVSPL